MVKKKKKLVARKDPAQGVRSFEASLGELENVVRDLEEGQLGLSESLQRYEEGVAFLKQCYASLREAERKIEILSGVDSEGNPVTIPLDGDDDLELTEKAKQRSRRRGMATPSAEPAEDESTDEGVDESGRLF